MSTKKQQIDLSKRLIPLALLALGLVAAVGFAPRAGALAPTGAPRDGGGVLPPPPKLKPYPALTTEASVAVAGKAKDALTLEVSGPAHTITV
jgi:hypothetical protein